MPASADRLQFAPPPAPGMLRAFGFAIAAHLLLMVALTWGINWNREPVLLAADAELWSAVPQQAAPKLVEATPPPPVPVPAPVPVPVPAPPPPAPPAAAKPEPVPEPPPREAEIAVEREKEKLADARRKKLALEREKKREAQKELAAQKKLEEQRELEAQRKLDARKKQELAKAKAAEERQQQQQESAKRLRQAEEAKRIEAQREDNLRRIQGMAGATGATTATGSATRSSGPSDSYAGRIRARVKPNIVFGEEIAGNPSAEVEVRTAPDGTIIGHRVVKSSGVRSWDEAVLKALIKTEVLPRDVDGRVHSPLTIVFRPKD